MWQDGQVGDIVKRDDGQVPFGISSGSANPVRIYSVHIISNGTAGQVKLYNGTSTSGELRYHLVGTASFDNYIWPNFEATHNTVHPCGCQGLPHHR